MNKIPSSFNTASGSDDNSENPKRESPMYDIRDLPETRVHPVTERDRAKEPLHRNHRKRIIDDIIKRQPN